MSRIWNYTPLYENEIFQAANDFNSVVESMKDSFNIITAYESIIEGTKDAWIIREAEEKIKEETDKKTESLIGKLKAFLAKIKNWIREKIQDIKMKKKYSKDAFSVNFEMKQKGNKTYVGKKLYAIIFLPALDELPKVVQKFADRVKITDKGFKFEAVGNVPEGANAAEYTFCTDLGMKQIGDGKHSLKNYLVAYLKGPNALKAFYHEKSKDEDSSKMKPNFSRRSDVGYDLDEREPFELYVLKHYESAEMSLFNTLNSIIDELEARLASKSKGLLRKFFYQGENQQITQVLNVLVLVNSTTSALLTKNMQMLKDQIKKDNNDNN